MLITMSANSETELLIKEQTNEIKIRMNKLLIELRADEANRPNEIIERQANQIAALKQEINDRDEIISKQSMYVMETFAHEYTYKISICYRIWRFLNKLHF